jgi:alkanesulfonate monooxygenase SsuD/methylene tetrahydromethanopterin reductase-like flavin-dependent oxidoreductase (luciferase family)
LYLGIGSGWFEREYGYEFGTAIGRLNALEEALPRIRARLAKLNPPPMGDLPILIGGGGEKVTLRLVAEHADAWNAGGTPDEFGHKNKVLDEWCAKIGRDPKTIERTVMVAAPFIEALPQYVDAGADHVLVSLGPPYDMSWVEKAFELAGK